MPAEASVCFKQTSLFHVRKLRKLLEAADSAVRKMVSDAEMLVDLASLKQTEAFANKQLVVSCSEVFYVIIL